MKKEIIKIIIKVLLYALGLVASYLGVSALTSCSSSRSIDARGKATVIIQDTTVINHGVDYYRNFKYRY